MKFKLLCSVGDKILAVVLRFILEGERDPLESAFIFWMVRSFTAHSLQPAESLSILARSSFRSFRLVISAFRSLSSFSNSRIRMLAAATSLPCMRQEGGGVDRIKCLPIISFIAHVITFLGNFST